MQTCRSTPYGASSGVHLCPRAKQSCNQLSSFGSKKILRNFAQVQPESTYVRNICRHEAFSPKDQVWKTPRAPKACVAAWLIHRLMWFWCKMKAYLAQSFSIFLYWKHRGLSIACVRSSLSPPKSATSTIEPIWHGSGCSAVPTNVGLPYACVYIYREREG